MDDNNNYSSEEKMESPNPKHTDDSVCQNNMHASKNSRTAREVLERELIKRLSKEKHQLAAEMEIKFKDACQKISLEHEEKYKGLLGREKQKLAKEKQEFQKVLKEKYTRMLKGILREKEKEISSRVKNKSYTKEVELRKSIDDLQNALDTQKQQQELAINSAALNAKKEQELESKRLYDDLVKISRKEAAEQTEQSMLGNFATRESELKREHEIALKKHTAKLINQYEEKLSIALQEQEQTFLSNNSEQLTRQSELFNHRIQQEVQDAVATATSKLELEHVKEKQDLNATIERLRPEVEANRLRMKVEVEKELREEFETKFSEFKEQIETAKAQELELLLSSEKQKLSEMMQEENLVVLKYKEREIRETCHTDFSQQLHEKVQDNLKLQEERLIAEHKESLENKCRELRENHFLELERLKKDHAIQLQAEVIQERARVTERNTNEKKLLLQQQENNMLEKHNSQIAHELAMQAQTIKQQHQIEIEELNTIIQELRQKQTENLREIELVKSTIPKEASISKPANEPEKQEFPCLITTTEKVDLEVMQAEKQFALDELENKLRIEFAQQLEAERQTWQMEYNSQIQTNKAAEIQECEKKLRREFQGILEQQRLQAATNFAKQRDLEIRTAIAKYKQKLLKEMENMRVNDLAAAEETLKSQYAARMQQHADLAKVEIERVKQELENTQNEKVQRAVDIQVASIQKDQDRKFLAYAKEQDDKLAAIITEEQKKLGVKFAQDKSNLVKELSAKFTREKHISMNKYETELREKLYKEMVKQKDFIQNKFSQAQDSALQEQKRRLESQHRHEIERIKQGYFDPNTEDGAIDTIIVERNVEQLADRILSKFQK